MIARVPFDDGALAGTLILDSHWPEGDWRNTCLVPEGPHASAEHARAAGAGPLPSDWLAQPREHRWDRTPTERSP
ncbi:MAG: hypothetical protein ACP5VP_01190 [Candidatus Limnocylindrales bacterium]